SAPSSSPPSKRTNDAPVSRVSRTARNAAFAPSATCRATQRASSMSSRIAALLGIVAWTSSALAQEEVDVTTAPAQPEAQAYAEPPPPPPPTSPFTIEAGPLPIEFHGYASQAYVVSSHNNVYNVESKGGSFHLTEVALNASSQVTERTRIVLQL